MDAIGSALAWQALLTHFGSAVTVWAADPLENYLKDLPGAESIVRTIPECVFDVVWVLDTSSFERIKGNELLSPILKSATLVNIDHHGDNTGYGTENILEVISSVGELVTWIYQYLNVPIDPLTANWLYAATAFDTGRFLYSNTTPKTFEAASLLVSAGANPTMVGKLLYEAVPQTGFQVLKVALDRLVVDHPLKLAYTSIPAGLPEESLKIIDFIRQMKEAEVFVVFKDQGDGNIRINVRSKGDFSVREFAHQFGGGGHMKAAGILISGELDVIVESVVSALRNALRNA